jgi:hypothetical protein
MSSGQVVGELQPPEFSEERILRLAVLGKDHSHIVPLPGEPAAAVAASPGAEPR